MTWQELVPIGEAMLPGRPYREAVDFGHTSDWWRDVALAMAAGHWPEMGSENEGHEHHDHCGDS
jgi:hypothetical protein